MSSHQMPVHNKFNTLYNITRGIVLLCFILILFPIFNIFYNLCCGVRKRNINQYRFIQSKVILSISMLLYALYVALITYETIGGYINLNFNRLFCQFVFSKFLIFALAKSLLYNYFILRANDTFYDTAYQFSTCFIQSILPIELFIVSGIMFPVQYWIISESKYEIQSTPYNNGQLCLLYFTQNISYYGLYVLLSIGGIIEIIFSCITLWLLFYKLIIVIQGTTNDIDIYQSLAHHHHNKDKRIDPNLSVNSMTTTTTTDESNTQRIADKVIGFHSKTANTNRSLLLITKLLTLLIVQIIFIIIAMIIYFITEMRFGYTMNAVSDVYCLWLTFKFSEKYYYEYCFGAKCSKLCFPFVKTRALSIRCICLCWHFFIDDDDNNLQHIVNESIFHPKYRFICCLCCCSRYYAMKPSKQRKIMKMAKSEIDLLLATKLDHKKRNDQQVWNE